MSEIRISAVAFHEDGAWIAQGIEYDICAFAADIEDLPEAFMRAVVENACITESLGREPLEGIRPAPDRFKAMFESGRTKLSPLRSVGPHLKPRNVDIRMAKAN